MHKLLALVSGAICSFSASIAAAAPSAQKPQSFAQLCLQEKNQYLRRLDANNQIVDVKPLVGLSNLTNLWLRNNKIVDIKPLAGLRNLTDLWLSINKIVDVKPLGGLRNLTRLLLERNQITVKVCPVKPESICKF